MVPKQAPSYLKRNHLWDAEKKTIDLHAARNEIVAFQILLHGRARQVHAALELDGQPPLSYTLGWMRCVATENGPLPDPVVTLDRPLDIPPADEQIANQVNTSLLCELCIPHDIAAGSAARNTHFAERIRITANRRQPADLELHTSRFLELPARNELLRFADERRRLLSISSGSSHGAESATLFPTRHDG